jgi:preprotein translocase SecE subunit
VGDDALRGTNWNGDERMAVAEARKTEKDALSRTPGWVAGVTSWFPRKTAELKAFFEEVRSELKKVTWPGRQEVYATTVVVVATSVFFGFYLFGLDLMLSRVASLVLR